MVTTHLCTHTCTYLDVVEVLWWLFPLQFYAEQVVLKVVEWLLLFLSHDGHVSQQTAVPNYKLYKA